MPCPRSTATSMICHQPSCIALPPRCPPCPPQKIVETQQMQDEVMDLRQARAEAQQQQQQQQMALEMATKQPELAMQAAGMAQAA